jgi:hypothetical protein
MNDDPHLDNLQDSLPLSRLYDLVRYLAETFQPAVMNETSS